MHGSTTQRTTTQRTMTQRSKKLITPLMVGAAALCAALVFGPELHAQAQRGLRCSVYITQARIPNGLSERGLLGFARGHRARRLRETGEPELNDRKWLANAVFQFNRAPGDLEFHALFYDITGGGRDFIREMSVFVSDRTQRTVLHRILLPRPTFRPNRRLEMVVTVRRNEVGTTRFETAGEEVQHSGMVDFSDGQ